MRYRYSFSFLENLIVKAYHSKIFVAAITFFVFEGGYFIVCKLANEA